MRMIVLFATTLLVLAGLRGLAMPMARAQAAPPAPATSGVAKPMPVPISTRPAAMATAATSPAAIHKSQRLAVLIWAVVAGALALLILVISMSFMRATRRLLLGREVRHGKTPYVDAWKLAGKRLRPPEPQNGNDDLSDSPDP